MVIVNLIPAEVQLSMAKQRHIRRWAVSVVVSASLVLAALMLDWAHQARASDLSAENEQLQAELRTVRDDLSTVTAESNQVLLQIERAKALRAKRAWSGVVALIGSCMPQGCWLSSISTDPARPMVAANRRVATARVGVAEEPHRAITIDAPRKLKITGYAPDSAQPHVFVTNLKDTGAFTTAKLGSSQRELVLDGSYYHFELVCEW